MDRLKQIWASYKELLQDSQRDKVQQLSRQTRSNGQRSSHSDTADSAGGEEHFSARTYTVDKVIGLANKKITNFVLCSLPFSSFLFSLFYFLSLYFLSFSLAYFNEL